MSSLKRKGAPSANPAGKDAKPITETRPSKKVRSDKPAKSSDKPAKSADKKGAKATDKTSSSAQPTTVVKDEEPLFPRGGGSILTPLEHKQISIEAKRDALFEESSGKPAKKGDKSDKGDKKRKRKSSTKEDKKSTRDEDAVRIEGLNYKRLVKGSLVLGQVCEINDLEIGLALPNNLLGHVSITAVSPALTKRIEAAAAEDDSDKDESPEDDVDLKTLFEIGQYLRAYVVSTMEDSSAMPSKSKRRIELSLRPEDTNSTLSQQELVANSTIMASIASVEDHGYVMDVGIPDSKITGFLPKKAVDADISGDRLQPGNVFLCIATGLVANRKVVQLSTQTEKLGSCKNFPSEATTINTFVPGTAVEVLVSEIAERGLIGKVMGDLDVTADHIHSGTGPNGTDLAAKYKVGSKIKARVICTFPEAKKPKLGVSILDHVKSLKTISAQVEDAEKKPLEALPISSLVEDCTVTGVEPDIGLFVDLGIEGVPGFVHISRVKDGKVDGLYESSGSFKVGSKHKGRVVGYNAFDGLFLLSFEKTVLEQPFLRIEDVPVGGVVNGVVEKLVVGENGVHGLILKLAEGISGLVPEMHLSDVRLQHPEKKFREGMKVKARVLSTAPSKRQIRLTLKKTLVNSDEKPIKSFDDVSVGMQVLGTIMNVLPNGAIVQFYGYLRGFLPLSEMSEAYISDPKEHFRQGQVVTVHVIDVDAENKKLVVSCKDPAAFGMDKQLALKNLKPGDFVSGKVSQKTEDDVFVELEGSLLKAVLAVGHLTDKSPAKNQAALKRIHVGQTLSELAVLEMNESRRALTVSMKPSLTAAAKARKLLSSWEKAKVGQLIQGFVRNITPTAVFVQFAGNLTALLPAALIPQDQQKQQDFGMHKLQSISVKIVSVDRAHSRAVVAIPSVADAKEENKPLKPSSKPVENAVDETIKIEDDISVGRITKAKIVSVKSTQLNVRLADNIQGRVDVSQVFNTWDEIRNTKNPLQKFKQNQNIKVKVLGVHDARNHRFLPISHRSTHSLIELSAKPSDLKDEGEAETLSLGTIEAGSEWIGFVNNIKPNCLWVNLSPSVRGRMDISDASDDLSLLSNPSASFPIGSAIKVQVKTIDASQSRLDLTAKTSNSSSTVTWDTVKKGLVLPGKVTKISERHVLVKLSEEVSGPVHLADLEDNYDEARPQKYHKNEIIQVAVVDVDASNKKLRLSTRPSKVLNSNLPVQDPEVTTVSALKPGEVVRGFVKNVADKGLFVHLGGHVTGFVKISDLSDSFLKDWKQNFRVDQVVKGRIAAVDLATGQVTLSLKASVVDSQYVAPKTIADFTEGEVVTGKVRAVEDFGAFIVIDGTANVSGLCHRSEMAEKSVKDARKLYSPGDAVKARIVKVDLDKKKISFGLKPSYFEDEESDEDMNDSDDDAGALLDSDGDDSDDDQEFLDAPEIIIHGTDNQGDSSDDEDEDNNMEGLAEAGDGLDAGGFDWSGGALDEAANESESASEEDGSKDKKQKKKRKPEIQVDRTAQLDANGPQTASDFERLLLGQPDSSDLWMQYMAFQLQVSEPAKAREIAERALRTINIREEGEKLNIWIAYLNLENAYGTEETLEEVFKRACQYNDEQVVHERLTTIYIKTGKHDKADSLFQTMLKKFGAQSPQVWINYAHFLQNTIQEPERARALLSRATQALPQHTHVPLMTKFAALEFRSASGDPERGRTMFEGLLSAYPKKFDLWNQLLDLEISGHAAAKKESGGKPKKVDGAAVREVFERGLKTKGLKPHRAKSWFQRWARWEEENGDAKSRERVSAKAKEWARDAETRKKNAAKGEDE